MVLGCFWMTGYVFINDYVSLTLVWRNQTTLIPLLNCHRDYGLEMSKKRIVA